MEELKKKLIEKMNLQLDFIHENSAYEVDECASKTFLNLAEAYKILSEIEED